jgi:hypothetical protein
MKRQYFIVKLIIDYDVNIRKENRCTCSTTKRFKERSMITNVGGVQEAANKVSGPSFYDNI